MAYTDLEKKRAYHREYKRRQRAKNPDCDKAAQKKWSEKNREYLRQKQREYVEKNREAIKAKQRIAYHADLEANRAKLRESYARHAEKRRTELVERRRANPELAARHAEDTRARRAANPERHRLYNVQYANAHKFEHREAQHRRRALMRQTPARIGGMTKQQWLEILEVNDHRCSYCLNRFDDLEMDHVVALTRGGLHTADNVVPACHTCNTSKNDKSLLEIFEPRLLIEQRRTVPVR